MRVLNILLTAFLFANFHAAWYWWVLLVLVSFGIVIGVSVQLTSKASLAEKE